MTRRRVTKLNGAFKRFGGDEELRTSLDLLQVEVGSTQSAKDCHTLKGFVFYAGGHRMFLNWNCFGTGFEIPPDWLGVAVIEAVPDVDLENN